MIGIKEIAELAKVSPATVSRVLNNTANVDSEKKNLILKIIDEKGYIPNQIGRSLAKKSSMIVGFIVPNIKNPFFSELARAIEDEAFLNGYKLILCNSDESVRKENSYLQMLETMNADGAIIISTKNKFDTSTIEKIKMPIVVLDREIVTEKVTAFIQSNNYEGTKFATQFLVNKECKKIVYLKAPEKYSNAKQRFEGYKDACIKNQIEIRTIDSDFSYEEGLKSSKMLFETYKDVDGIIACNDVVAISVLKVAKEFGLSVPKDFLLIGFDDIEMAKMVSPEITTIKQPKEDIAKKAFSIILKSRNSEARIKIKNILDVTLIERESTRR